MGLTQWLYKTNQTKHSQRTRMLKLCHAKRPSASAAPAAKRQSAAPVSKRLIYFGKRPSGTPPFEFVNEFFDWAAGPMTEPAPCSIIMSKADGFQAQIIPGPLKECIWPKEGGWLQDYNTGR